jgi:hypothetical protein
VCFSYRIFIPRLLTAVKSAIVKVYHPCNNPFSHLDIFNNLNEPQFFKSASIGTIRYRSYVSKEQTRDDSCVLFTKNGHQCIGRILIIVRDKNQDVLFLIQPAVVEKSLTFSVSRKMYTCPNVFFGHFESNNFVLHSWRDLNDKLAYVYNSDRSCIFFRFPNLVESS